MSVESEPVDDVGWWAIFDATSRRELDMSGEDFIKKFDAGGFADSMSTAVERVAFLRPTGDQGRPGEQHPEEELVPLEGCTRCWCGAKYWDVLDTGTFCASCGEPFRPWQYVADAYGVPQPSLDGETQV